MTNVTIRDHSPESQRTPSKCICPIRLPRPLFKVWIQWARRTPCSCLRTLPLTLKAASAQVCSTCLPPGLFLVLMVPIFPGYSVLLTADTKQSTPYTYTSQAGPYDLSSQQMIIGPSPTNSPLTKPAITCCNPPELTQFISKNIHHLQCLNL